MMEEINQKLEILLNRTKDLDKLSNLVNEISCRLVEVEDKLKNVATKVENHVKEVTTKVIDIEKSIKFTDSQYDKQKKTTDYLTKRDGEINSDIKTLQANVTNLQNELEQEKASRNDDAQHARSSTHVKILGVPLQSGEDDFNTVSSNNEVTRMLIKNLADAAKFEEFTADQIDVCHRVGADIDSPIIVRFKYKCDRMHFFSQRKLLQKVDLKDLKLVPYQPTGDEHSRGRGGGSRGRGGSTRGRGGSGSARQTGQQENGNIYMQESLTKYSSDLLKELKVASTEKKYKYTGYIFNGQIRAKKEDDAKFVRIRCRSDFAKL